MKKLLSIVVIAFALLFFTPPSYGITWSVLGKGDVTGMDSHNMTVHCGPEMVIVCYTVTLESPYTNYTIVISINSDAANPIKKRMELPPGTKVNGIPVEELKRSLSFPLTKDLHIELPKSN